MFRRTLGIATLALAAAAAPTRADIMHWFWEVEVNGEAVEVGSPIGVVPGDQVDIELWAHFDPYRDGFAAAEFAVVTGDRFFESGRVSVDYSEGYGLNPYLTLGGKNGKFADSDGDGTADIVDDIVAFQLHPDWGSAFDPSEPVLVYGIGWQLDSMLDGSVVLAHTPQLSGRFHSAVWDDPYTAIEYTPSSDSLVFVPSAGSTCALVLAGAIRMRRHRVSGV